MDDQAIVKIGVIINPLSGRKRGKGRMLADTLKNRGMTGADLALLEDFSQLEPALNSFAKNKIETLFISSGDGTIQAIQTAIAESGRFEKMPKLCLLPHGTTNMTAADLGFTITGIDNICQFILAGVPNKIRTRQSVKVENPRSGKPLHGMFFGTGAVAEAALYCQRVFNDNGLGGSWATFATLATAVGKSLFLSPNPTDPNRFDRPFPLRLEANGEIMYDGPHLTMLATTLEKLILGSKPFWGGATAPIRTTVIPYPLPSIPRWLIPSLYGGENRRAPPGAISRAVTACTVVSSSRFVIDGEFHDASADKPLRVVTGPVFEFIVS